MPFIMLPFCSNNSDSQLFALLHIWSMSELGLLSLIAAPWKRSSKIKCPSFRYVSYISNGSFSSGVCLLFRFSWWNMFRHYERTSTKNIVRLLKGVYTQVLRTPRFEFLYRLLKDFHDCNYLLLVCMTVTGNRADEEVKLCSAFEFLKMLVMLFVHI